MTVTGNSTVNVTGSLVLGGYAGSSGTFGNAGAGGAGIFNLGGGSTLNLTGASFTINGNGTFNLGDATVNDTTAGTITGLSSVVNNGQINFNQTDTSTISANISGTGRVSHNGSGTTILTGNNTYTGGTTIAAGGTLEIGNGGAGASLAGNVMDNGTLAFNHSDNWTFSGTISGSGSVTQSGTGMLTLSGANTYAGTTTIGGGTLKLMGDTASLTGNIANGGALIFGQSANSSYSGVISGSGSVAQSGTGTLTLSSANAYSGTTTIASGALALTGDTSNLTGNITDSSTLIFGQSANSTYSGSISGGGSVTQSGTGTLTLSGANVYTGGTTISSGTLQVGNGGVSGSLSGSVANNGALAFNRSDNVVFSGAISGSGSVAQSGGSLTLSATNTYTGSTRINGGATLALSGTGSVANSSVADSGTLDISSTGGTSIQSLSGSGNVVLGGQTLTLSNANGAFSGVISGTGGLTIGAGTETLTNVNTYTGTTTIGNAATLILSSANNIALGNVVNFGNLQISGSMGGLSGTGSVSVGTAGLVVTGSGSFGGVISGAGGLSLSGSNETLSGTNTYAGVTTIDRGSALLLSGTGSIAESSGVTANGTLDISGTATGATIQNLSGMGSVKLGSRTLTLSNAIGSFSGTFGGSGTLVKQGSGTWILNGNSSSFTGTTEVNAGLLEVGDINTPSALLGGNVSVDAAGTLRGHGTVEGDVSNQGMVMPGGSIGTLTVSGNYTQAGNATLAIEVSPTQASQLKVGGSAALAGTLAITYAPGTYSAKTYTLVSASGISGKFASVTTTGASNLGALTPSLNYDANAVDLALNVASTPADPLVIAPTNTSVYTAVGTSAIFGAQAQGAALLDRLGQISRATAAQPYGWISATGSRTKVGSTNGQPGFHTNRFGFLAGLDKRFGASTAGVAIGYDHTDINEQNTGDSGTTDTLRAALYGTRNVGPVNLAATLGAGLDFLSQKRPFGVATTAEGDHMGQELSTGAQASLPMTFGSVTVTPRAGLRHAYFHANGFGESGAGGQDLNVGTDNVRSLQPYVGVTVDRAFGDALKPVNAELRLGYARELLDANRAINVAAQDGTVFVAPGTNLPRGFLTAGASVTLHPLKNLDVSLSYDTVISTTHASAQQGNVRVGYQF
ncbi:autotransporter domain-containing protein [Trinickia dabaoshanensis]|uniref:autotransporter domain-containing protein n=1 Tax=Trinickia dabaoshanensis TaxID=564714 RepID=UPI00130496FA|nr:autotransporter domain-containing protein [Trinickia dabaoshanensis]